MKQKIMSLDRAFLGAIPWLSWESVQVIGKNNIQYLIAMINEEVIAPIEGDYKDLKKELLTYRQDAIASKELSDELNLCKRKLENRKTCILELRTIAQTATHMPCLVSMQGYKKWRLGEPVIYVWKGKWRYGFLLYANSAQACILRCKKDFDGQQMLAYSSVETASWMSLSDARLLQKQQDNKEFMELWQQSRLSSSFYGHYHDELAKLLTMSLCTPKEVLALRKASKKTFIKKQKKKSEESGATKYAVELASQIKS